MTTEAEALQKMRDLEERIKAPSIWGRTPCGIRFEDLQDRRYEEAVKFLKKHYISEEIVFRSVKLSEDKEGTDEFVHNARIWMKDKMSIAAVKDGTDKLVGVLIMRIQEKRKYRKNGFSRTFSRVKITYNPNYTTIMKFYNELEKPLDIFTKLGIRRYLKIYVLAVKNRYRHRGISKEMLLAAVNLSKSAMVPALTGFFQTSRAQQIASEVGFQKLNEIYYTKYYVDEKMVFCDTGLGNYGNALMAYRIPDVVEPKEEARHQASLRFSISKEGEILGVEEVEDEENEQNEQTSV